MDIKELRDELTLNMEDFALRLGLKSKSYVHRLENGEAPSVKVALRIEQLSGGRIDAASLNPDVALVRRGDAA